VEFTFSLKETEADNLLLRIKEMSGGRDVPEFLGVRFDCR
jgi:hypothetical protein